MSVIRKEMVVQFYMYVKDNQQDKTLASYHSKVNFDMSEFQ